MTEKGSDHFFMKHFRGWRSVLLQALLFAAFFALLEFFFHLTEKLDFTYRFVYPILFCLPTGFFFAGFCSLLPAKWNCIFSTVVMAAVSLWFCTQICYSGTFQTYMEVSKITMAGDVAAGFGHEMADAVLAKLPYMIAIGIAVVLFSLFLFIRLKPDKKSPLLCGMSIVICLVLHLFCRGALILGGEGPYSPSDMYTQYPRILDNNIENFGVITSLRQEICDLVFGHEDLAVTALALADTDIPSPKPSPTAAPEARVGEEVNMGTVSENDVEDEPSVVKKQKNVIDIDMEAFIAQEEDPQLLAIHQYVASLPGSSTNEYTGCFQGYNLIMICAESFSSRMISEELTPTLYKMANNGFVFQNYYGMFKSITTNGEYAFCTGLIPNTVGSASDLKQNSTFLLSADKYLPYCMGNVFESMDVSAYAYHGNVQSYYRRDITYPNMGYQLCRFLDGSYVNGVYTSEGNLIFSRGQSKPTSDEEMLLQTLGDYLEDRDEDGRVKPFHAYYMTYSGHHPYSDIYDGEQTVSNPMILQNRDRVDELEYSGVVQSYLAANLEVEDMVTALMVALEEAGCLENTVIVLTNDHYPYGLQTSQFNELAGESVDTDFGIYENCFICYNAGMEMPVIVDTPCCTVDILPTLLNLFGVDYDSRLLAGTDILDPNSFHIAMLYNQSFVTDMVQYNATKGTADYLVDKDSVPEGYLDSCIAYVRAKFALSLEIVKNDYYRIFYDFAESVGKKS